MRSARKFFAAALIVSLVAVGLFNTAHASESFLDPTFNFDGKQTTAFFSESNQAQDVAVQPNGKIVVGGYTVKFNNPGYNYDFALARYNSDGSLDPDFGRGGKVTTDFSHSVDQAMGLVLQPNGKIVMAGFAYIRRGTYPNFFTSADIALTRYNLDGSLDHSFGDGGKVATDFAHGDESAQAIAIQPDGKLIVAGATFPDYFFDPAGNFALVRYNINGSLDDGTANDSTPGDSFGNGGKVITDFSGDDRAFDLAVQPDGKVLAAGFSGFYFTLARYTSDGGLDSNFGSGGRLITDFNGAASSVVLQPDGKIVVAGFGGSAMTGRDFALARYNDDGSVDHSFGSGGKVTTDFLGFRDQAQDVVLQPDGKIMAAGFIRRDDSPPDLDIPPDDFALARYNPDGSLDTTFGEGGKLTTNFGGRAGANAVALQRDGKIVAVGTTNYYAYFAVARYLGDASEIMPTLDSLTLDARKIPGGTSLQGTITLSRPALPGGAKVSLRDTLDAIITRPNITVPAGETTATFTIKTKSVATTQAGNIIARLDASTKTAQLVVEGIKVSSVGLFPDSVEGRKQVTGIVDLTAPAPAGGVTIMLSSRNPAVASPVVSSINIPAGARSGVFKINTRGVTSPRSVLITATLNGMSKSSALSVH